MFMDLNAAKRQQDIGMIVVVAVHVQVEMKMEPVIVLVKVDIVDHGTVLLQILHIIMGIGIHRKQKHIKDKIIKQIVGAVIVEIALHLKFVHLTQI